MANFLITTPNSLTQGTDTTDLFVINTALGTTVNGAGGADTYSATVTNGSNAVFAAAAGNDTIFITANGVGTTLASLGVYAGQGSDLVAVEGLTTNSTLKAGGGNDTINFSGGTFTDSTVYGNLGSDLISANGGVFTRAFIAAGGDNDTIAASARFVTATVNGGGGADSIFLTTVADTTATLVQGDDPNDGTYFGNDTIRFADGGGAYGTTTVLGGGGADRFIMSAAIASGNNYQGGTGADSIFLNNVIVSAQLFIGMGAGNDSITVSAALANTYGTIQGGGGVDVIQVSGAAANGGLLYGGADGDAIGLGTVSQGTWGTGAAVGVAGASGVTVAYTDFSQSNLAGFDVVSANAAQPTSGGNVFMVNQSAVTFSAVANGNYGVAGNQITVATGSRVTTFAAGTNSLTARAAAIDASVGVGGTVIFQAGATSYLFVQGGIAGSGTDGDLVVQLNVGGFAALSGTTNGGVYGIDANNVKIAFTDNGTF
jgi:hypothetical protein